MRNRLSILFIVAFLCSLSASAQVQLGNDDRKIDFLNPQKYEIGGINVKGTEKLDKNAIRLLSGLKTGDRVEIPGSKITDALRSIYDQGLFADVKIAYEKIIGNTIFLEIYVKERPRLSKYSFSGKVTKSEADKIREKINLYREKIVTENLKNATQNIVRGHYIDKGFKNVKVTVTTKPDTTKSNHVKLEINVQKSKKVRIHKIMPEGNTAFSDRKIKRMLKETKEHVRVHPFAGLDTLFVGVGKAASRADLKSMFSEVGGYVTDNIKLNIFKSSKYITSNYRSDKEALIAKYNEKGYRDAQVVWDSVYMIDQKRMNIRMRIQEGHKYYFRDIKWIGNTKYATKDLQRLMGINKGDVYDPIRLSSRLSGDANGGDISALYMDDGYLFFDIQPVEVFVEGDSVDIEIRIREGQQARINKVTISGNTKTNDHVILREIRTKPGQLFSRSDIIRSQQQLASLGYFDAEQLNVIPKPNPEDGTVDIEYVVAERPSDQIELSGGWGGNRIVGTLGVVFTNFSTRNFFKKGAWTPLPSGDGQRLSLRASTNGRFFQSYNFSFTEPWLGGKKPNSFSIGASYSHQSNGADGTITDDEGNRIDNPDHQSINIIGLSLGLGKQLTVPDDYFSLLLELNYQHYDLDNWRQFIFNTGKSNNLFGRITLSRTSIDRPIYPRRGSRISISSQLTLPYSKFDDKDYANLENQEKYRWIEYHKWKVTSDWYNTIFENLVLRTKVGFGFLGHYNDEIGPAPFERFYLGGSGLTGFQLDGREIIALRGYDDNSISPSTGSTIISKYTMELRYPFSLNPSATIYGLAFVEAGNTWGRFGDFNPFSVNRSAGVGIRIFLPMFGLLGLDWGRRFDDIPGRPNMSPAQIHFTIGANLGEL